MSKLRSGVFCFGESLFPLASTETKREEGSPQQVAFLIFSHPTEVLRGCYWSEEVERLFVQSSECYERIESFASPPYFFTLLKFKCEYFLHGSTVERRYNEPLHNEVLRMTNDFLYPSNIKIDEKDPRCDNEQILPVNWPFVLSRFHCTN